MILRAMKSVAALLVLALLSGGRARAEADPAVALILNPSVKEVKLDALAVQKMFLGKKRSWEGGGIVVLAVLQEGPTHEAFLREYVGKTPSQFTSHWRKLVFTGKDSEPRSFATEAEVVAFVAATPGAVGYVGSGIEKKGVVQAAVTK